MTNDDLDIKKGTFICYSRLMFLYCFISVVLNLIVMV